MSASAYLLQRELHKEERVELKTDNDVYLLRDYKLWVALLLMQMSFGSFYNFFTIYETDHGLSMDMTIYLWSFGVLVEVGMLYGQGRFLQKNLLHVLEFTVGATVVRWFLVFAFPTNLVVLFFSQALHALSFALFHSAAIAYLYQKYTNRSLSQQFFSGITYGLGGLSGALLAGYIYEYYPSLLFLSSAFIALGSLVMLKWYEKEPHAVA
jgi:PPP family 3-phenylpropionic acid transporter